MILITLNIGIRELLDFLNINIPDSIIRNKLKISYNVQSEGSILEYELWGEDEKLMVKEMCNLAEKYNYNL